MNSMISFVSENLFLSSSQKLRIPFDQKKNKKKTKTSVCQHLAQLWKMLITIMSFTLKIRNKESKSLSPSGTKYIIAMYNYVHIFNSVNNSGEER